MSVFQSRNAKKIGLPLLLVTLGASAYGYYLSGQDIEQVAIVCPMLLEDGDCDCFVDAFARERGPVQGTLANMPVLNAFFSESPEQLQGLMDRAANACGATLANYGKVAG